MIVGCLPDIVEKLHDVLVQSEDDSNICNDSPQSRHRTLVESARKREGKGEREGGLEVLRVVLNWASEASPTWMVHLRFFIYYYYYYYYYYRTYVGGLCDPLFFFLRRALWAVQSSCTVLLRCARPTHALHAPS